MTVLAQVAGSNPSVPKKNMYTGKEVTWERERKREGRKAKPKAKGRRAQGEKQKAKARYTAVPTQDGQLLF